MTSAATGAIDGPHVMVMDAAEANRLHNKSLAGTPQSGNSLRLHRIEAAYCMEQGWLDVPDCTVADMLTAGAAEGGQNEVDHLCYRDLRQRGLTVRLQGGGMQVWARGATTKQDAWFTTYPFAERVPVTVSALADLAGDNVSVVDEDGAVTHYALTTVAAQGDMRPPTLPTMAGVLLDDRVLVTDPDGAQALLDACIGTPHGDGCILSLVEAEALRRQGTLQVDDGLAQHAMARHPAFAATLSAYEALRAAGVLAKSGFRFGTHLRGYAVHPDDGHAEWLIQCAMGGVEVAWSDLSRAVRLAHGVRKKFLLAVADEPVRFVEMAWFRP